MAMVKCHECGNDVSSEAKACPKCGAGVKKPKRPVSRLILVLGVVAMVGGIAVIGTDDRRPAAAADPAQAAETAAINRALPVARSLRSGLKNPASWELSSVLWTDRGALCFEFRGTNSFGAVVPSYAVALADGSPVTAGSLVEVRTVWAKHCANESAQNLTRMVKRFMD